MSEHPSNYMSVLVTSFYVIYVALVAIFVRVRIIYLTDYVKERFVIGLKIDIEFFQIYPFSGALSSKNVVFVSFYSRNMIVSLLSLQKSK